MRILVVEDDVVIAGLIRKGLEQARFQVDIAGDGASGLQQARTGDYSLIILDVMLPLMDGWKICANLRESHSLTPILMLTARDAIDDRVKGLELGADDYLVKPFAFSELLARIRSVLRRGQGREADQIQIGDLEVDLLKRKVTRGEVRIDLTAKEFALLALLLRRHGEVLSRTLIAEQVWDMNFDSDTNVVDVAIRRLRAKVDDPFERKLIHTIRGVGYVLEERT